MKKFIGKIQEIERSEVVSKKITKVSNRVKSIIDLYKAFK